MNEKLDLRNIGDNIYVYYRNNKQLKTIKGNIIKVSGIVYAKKILRKIKTEIKVKNSNFLKLFFYSYDLDFKQRQITIINIINFLDTDLVCYRANNGTELEAIQKKIWDPYINFCEKYFELKYQVNNTVMPFKQDISNKKKLVKILNDMDNSILTAFFFLVEITNSIIISLNIMYKHISPNVVWRDCNLEYEYNQMKWGEDEDFNEKLLFKKNFFIDIIKYSKFIKFKENNGK